MTVPTQSGPVDEDLSGTSGLTLRCTLPEPFVELPEVLPEQRAEAAAELADHMFAGLTDDSRRAVVERYTMALRARAAQGTAIVAMVQGRTDEVASGSLMTLRLVGLQHDDAEVAATAMLAVFRRAGPLRTEVAPVALPLGPGVARLRHRTLRADSDAGPVDVPLALLELFVPLPGRRAMLAQEQDGLRGE